MMTLMVRLTLRSLLLMLVVCLVSGEQTRGQAGGGAAGLGNVVPMRLGESHPAMGFMTLPTNHQPTWHELSGKVVVVDFWATWCAPCLSAFPKMNQLKKHFADKPVAFYSITYETPAMIAPVLRRFPLKTTVAIDDDFKTFRSFNAWAIPVVYIFDAEGRLAAEVNAADLSASLIAEILAGKVPKVPQQMAWSDPKGAEYYFRSLRDSNDAHKPKK